MNFRLLVILSILITQHLFANEDFITLKGLNVATPYGEVESILSKKGYKCHDIPLAEGSGITNGSTQCKNRWGENIGIYSYTNNFIVDRQLYKVTTFTGINFDCVLLNACGRGKELVDLLVRKYKLIKMTEADIVNYNNYEVQTRRIPNIDFDSKYGYYCNPNNNDVLIYNPYSESFKIVPYKYESEKLKKLKKMDKGKKKQVGEPFHLE